MTPDIPPTDAQTRAEFDAISGQREPLRELVERARSATSSRMVQITHFDRQSGLVESLAWAGFHVGLADAALRMAWRLFPNFDPYQVRPRVDHNPCSERVYLRGQAVRAPFDSVALGAVDHRILALAIGVGKIRESYMHPLRLSGQVFGALGFHAQDISEAQLSVMQGLALEVETLLAQLAQEAHAAIS